MVSKFEIGKSYSMGEGFKFRVTARFLGSVSGSVWGYIYNETGRTPTLRKEIFIVENKEVLKFGNLLVCCSDYFSRG